MLVLSNQRVDTDQLFYVEFVENSFNKKLQYSFVFHSNAISLIFIFPKQKYWNTDWTIVEMQTVLKHFDFWYSLFM